MSSCLFITTLMPMLCLWGWSHTQLAYTTGIFCKNIDFNWVDHSVTDISISLQWKSAPPFCLLLLATWHVWTLWNLSPLAHGAASPARRVTTWLGTTHSSALPLDSGANLHLHAQVGNGNVRAPWKCTHPTLLWWDCFFLFSGTVPQFRGPHPCLHAMPGPSRSEQLWLNMHHTMW